MSHTQIVPAPEGRGLRFLYRTSFGRCVLAFLRSRTVSKLCGVFMDSSLSKGLIPSFVKNNGINLDEYYSDSFRCFNDCFTRKIRDGLRPFDMSEDAVVSPCDGLVSAYRITDKTVIPVKMSRYSVESLLQSTELAEKYRDGVCVVFRLCVNHYHRYAYLDSGKKGENHFISGTLHTVRPIALREYPVFTENCREYTVMETEHLGDVTQIEVGAMLVGKIANLHGKHEFARGEEKGMFLYGGSTVMVLFENNRVNIDKDFFDATSNGAEIPVKMGERIGTVCRK